MTIPVSASSSSVAEFRPPRHASPQPLLEDGTPYPTAGPLVRRWIERMLVHGEGDALGDPVRMPVFWRYVLNRIYEFNPQTGRLLHSRVLIGMPKGNSKTEGVAHIGLAELAGPIAPTSPNVPVSAASWEQANKLFKAARLAITGDGEFKKGPLADYFREGEHLLEDRILLPDREGSLYRIAAVGGTNDGGLPTCHLGDEVHEWEGENRERVYVVQGKSLRKRVVPRPRGLSGALQIGISTAGDDLDSLLGQLYLHGVKVAAGEIEDPQFLFLWWEADEHWNLDVPEQLDAAILEANPAVGAWLPIENLIDSFRDPTVGRHEFERYNLNRWATPPDRWLSRAAWAAARHPDKLGQPPDGTEITVGFDGSDVDDSTAIIGCTVDERPHLFKIAVWERDLRDPNWTVPRVEVDAAIAETFTRWNVRRMAPDEARWQSDIERWRQQYGADVVLRVLQTNERMAPMADRFRAGVLRRDPDTGLPDPLLTHDGDPTLSRHITNAHTRATKWGLAIRKERPESPKKIDAAAAAIQAYDEAIRPAKPKVRRYSQLVGF